MKKHKRKRQRNTAEFLEVLCPGCGKDTVSRSKHPKRWDLLMRLLGRIPLRCQRCGCRFYMSARRYAQMKKPEDTPQS